MRPSYRPRAGFSFVEGAGGTRVGAGWHNDTVTDLDEYIASFETEPGYLDWARFGPLSATVRSEAQADAELLSTGRRTSIDHVAGRAPQACELLATLLDVRADQVTLQPSTTHGIVQALYGLDGSVAVSRAEFPGVTISAARAAHMRDGLRVQWMEPEDGYVSADAVRDALTDETTAVAVSLVDFRTGYTADLSALRDVIGDRLLIVDAVQGFGVVDADFTAADVVCGNGYKWLRAGRGTGWAYYSDRARERLIPALSGYAGAGDGAPTADGVPAAASGARAFTITGPDHLAAGRLNTALQEIVAAGVPGIAAAVADHTERLIAIADEHGVPVATPRARAHQAGITALAPSPSDAAATAAALANNGVVFTARSGMIRLSAHAGTTPDTLQMVSDALDTLPIP